MLTIHVLSHFGLLEMISLHCLPLMNAALLLSSCVIALVDSSGVLS
ncbi:unknow [Vibrio campbellii]|nr:unknow [Vibrio campbellii]